MANCIPSISYTMKADIYTPSITQDPDSGAINESWTFLKTIDCVARGILRKGVGDNSTTVDIQNYLNVLNSMIKFRSRESIPFNYRVVNVRNSDGVIFVEGQDPSSQGGFQGSTIFEPRGSTPLLNFDGKLIEYETVLVRQEVQRLG